MATKKPQLHELAILNWLCTHDGPGKVRFILNSEFGLDFYETVDKTDDGYIVRKVLESRHPREPEEKELVRSLHLPSGTPSCQSLISNRYIVSYNQFVGGQSLTNFFSKLVNLDESVAYRTNLHRLTKSGVEYWESEGRDLFRKLEKKKNEEIAEVSRYVLVGQSIKKEFTIDKSKVPHGVNLTLPVYTRVFTDPAFFARVIKETDTRLYIDDVEDVRRKTAAFGEGFKPVNYKSYISGSGTRTYVSKEDVIKDPATKADVRRIKEINDEYADDFERIANEALAQIEEVIDTMNSRILQKQAEQDDVMREILSGEDSKPPYKP